jgi:hypothetical protein
VVTSTAGAPGRGFWRNCDQELDRPQDHQGVLDDGPCIQPLRQAAIEEALNINNTFSLGSIYELSLDRIRRLIFSVLTSYGVGADVEDYKNYAL